MWPNFSADLDTFTEETLNRKFHFLRSVRPNKMIVNLELKYMNLTYWQ